MFSKQWSFYVTNGPRDQTFQHLPPGQFSLFANRLGEQSKRPGPYTSGGEGQHFKAEDITFRVIPIPLCFAASYNADYRVLKPLIDSLAPERYEYTPIQRKRNSDRNAQGSHCAENATRPGSREAPGHGGSRLQHVPGGSTHRTS